MFDGGKEHSLQPSNWYVLRLSRESQVTGIAELGCFQAEQLPAEGKLL